jgi:glucosamine--fructose-6-phosphate aminotransferase (isomerizing)
LDINEPYLLTDTKYFFLKDILDIIDLSMENNNSLFYVREHNKSINENIRKQYIKSLRNISLHIKQVLNMNNDIWKKVALITIKSKTVFILGRGEMQYIAQEIALKFKEICYIHAEGYPSGALKHGPFALIDENTLIFVLSPKDEYYDKNLNTIEEINSRKAQIIVLTNSNENILELENNIILPNNDKFNSIIYTIALQLIAYEIALLKGHNPDYPKNLAKVVTVDG